MKIKKLNKSLHKWLSIPLGAILFIVCLTGAALVFQKEILELSNPHHYKVSEVKGQAIPLDKLVPIINGKLGDNTISGVEVSNDPKRTYKMSLSEGFRVTVFVDQYTGEIVGKYAPQDHAFFSIMRLHRWLLDSSRTWGKNIVGWSTVAFIIIIITGLLYRSKKTKDNYVIHFNKGSRRLIFGLHNTLGIYASILLIIFSLSGLMWSFDWYRNGVFALFGDKPQTTEGEPKRERRGGKQSKDKKTINVAQWQNVLDKTLTTDSGYDYIKVSDGSISAHPDNTYRTRVQDKITFNSKTGEITQKVLFSDQDVKTKVWAWAYSLHVGDFWGIWSKILAFITCLIGASLPATGYYMTIKQWIKKRRRRK